MMIKKQHKYLIAALAACLFAAPVHLAAQSEVNMVNHDTIVLDACVLGGGTIYDDGGATNYYSDNFDGWASGLTKFSLSPLSTLVRARRMFSISGR